MTVAAAALAATVLTAPSAVAAHGPEFQTSKKADAQTKSFVQANPQAVAAAATVCGSGFDQVSKVVPLPEGTDPRERLATLFSYINDSGKGCAILDNNVGSARYMYLKVCDINGRNCDTDSGTFSQYAGPVYVPSVACAPVTAKMGKSSSDLSISYKSEYVFPCN
ncbi:hypothetical protein [Streptomyces milbemycinicus]|uniref:Secreted protein n=1 Tax=Streptomyces milbemycinicus TaxID=476552 RepID=A0ABW8LY13_9ACTN